jgi:RNA polymerase sigma factor (sigma-70 family)
MSDHRQNRSTPPDAPYLVTTTGIPVILNEPMPSARRRRPSPQAQEAPVVVAPPPAPEVDRGALIEQLCGLHRDYILKTLLHQSGITPASAHDLTQVTLLALALEVAAHGSPRDPKQYVCGIMRNVLRDRWNLRLRMPQIEDGADVDAEMDGGRDPEEEAEFAERWAKLARYLDELPAREADAFRRIELEGQTIEEAAAAIGRPRSTVADRLSRAYARLRERVQESARGTQLAAALAPPEE